MLFLHLKTSHLRQSNSASQMVVPELNLFQIPLSTGTCFHRLEKSFLSSLPECHIFNTSGISIWLYHLWSTANTSMAGSCTSLLCLQFLRLWICWLLKRLPALLKESCLLLWMSLKAVQRLARIYRPSLKPQG